MSVGWGGLQPKHPPEFHRQAHAAPHPPRQRRLHALGLDECRPLLRHGRSAVARRRRRWERFVLHSSARSGGGEVHRPRGLPEREGARLVDEEQAPSQQPQVPLVPKPPPPRRLLRRLGLDHDQSPLGHLEHRLLSRATFSVFSNTQHSESALVGSAILTIFHHWKER